MLYPQLNEKRFLISLNGIWDFALGDESLDVEKLCKPLPEPEKAAEAKSEPTAETKQKPVKEDENE